MKFKFYEGNAFTNLSTLSANDEAPGNPAVICLSNETLVDNTMKEISQIISSPMTTFLAPNKQGDADYNIFYFSPNGTRVDLCGHATLVATNAVLEKIKNTQVKYRLDPYFFSNYRIINGFKIDEEAQIIFPIQKSSKKNIIPANLLHALQLLIDDIDDFYISNLNDYIFILNDVEKLYTIKPNFQSLIDLCNTSAPHRTVVVTAKSNEAELDYEARVFAPTIGVNEDIACGSVNCSIAKIWAEFFSKNSLQMAYRSVLTKTFNKIGGYQRLTLNNSEITISANVRKVWEKKLIANTEKDLLEKVKSNIAPIAQKTTPMLLSPLGNGVIASTAQ